MTIRMRFIHYHLRLRVVAPPGCGGRRIKRLIILFLYEGDTPLFHLCECLNYVLSCAMSLPFSIQGRYSPTPFVRVFYMLFLCYWLFEGDTPLFQLCESLDFVLNCHWLFEGDTPIFYVRMFKLYFDVLFLCLCLFEGDTPPLNWGKYFLLCTFMCYFFAIGSSKEILPYSMYGNI